MKRLFSKRAPQKRIVHELPCRLRILNSVFHDPAFDPVYVEAILHTFPGVEQIRFNRKTATVVVHYNGAADCRKKILDTLFHIPPEAYGAAIENREAPDPVGVGAKGVLALLTPVLPRPVKAVASWWVALPILFEGMETLFNEGVKVEVLDATAVGFSLWRKDYFTTNSIAALLAAGSYLEKSSDTRTTGLLKSLLLPQQKSIWVERDGVEVELDVGAVTIGDLVICGPGEMIPVDGPVAEGEASVNQSSITGEAVPVHVSKDDEVLSGSVIEEGRIKILARKVGSETGMARINRFLENSLRNQSAAQKLSDQLADRLVPTTFALGLGLLAVTRDIRRAAAVLTVDYSCAIKLANPVAAKTAMYAAAQSGVLLKGSQALDALAQVDTMVFDKTGTLTMGNLAVTDILPVGTMTEEELLALAAGAEEHYDHPVARAVVGEARKRKLSLAKTGRVDFIVAHGVSAYVDDKRVLVGSYHFIGEDEEISCDAVQEKASALRKQGKNLLYVARDDVLEGVLALRDTLRPEAPAFLRDLKAHGIEKIVVLTGDHPDTAKAIAKELDALDDIHWDLKPEDKATIVKSLQKQGHRIAFAGDGVNDAPALITAEVGVCMPGGADLARESAQVILLKEDLYPLLTAFQIAKKTSQTVRNCFHTSVGLNTLFLLLAVGGKLPPVMAAMLHNLNTVGTLGYAAMSGMQIPEMTSAQKEQSEP